VCNREPYSIPLAQPKKAVTQDTPDQIERACTALSIAYARAIDFRDYHALIELFTPDGSLDVGEPLHGRDAIWAALMQRPDELRSRHVISNVFIEALNADTARGVSYLTLYRHHGEASVRHGPAPLTGPAAVGHYEDRFVRLAQPDGSHQWLFQSRRLHLAFRDPAAF
jgi:hypothetical protein